MAVLRTTNGLVMPTQGSVRINNAEITTACERSKLSPWCLNGGQEGLANNCFILIIY